MPLWLWSALRSIATSALPQRALSAAHQSVHVSRKYAAKLRVIACLMLQAKPIDLV
jgi:hypothetical protein